MSFATRRPLVALAALVLAMLVLVPASYALVTRVLLTVDTDKSEQEIEQDIVEQLESAGFSPDRVTVEKSGDGSTRIEVMTSDDDPDLSPADFEIAVEGGAGESHHARRRLDVELASREAADMDAVRDAAQSDALAEALAADIDDDERRQRVAQAFADHGLDDVVVTVTGDRVTATIGAAAGTDE